MEPPATTRRRKWQTLRIRPANSQIVMTQQHTTITSFSGEFAFLSNFFHCKVEFEGITFPTTEHAYQAAKTLDQQERLHISMLMTPGKAKRAGRNVTLRPDWEDAKLGVMERVLRQKFSQPEMSAKLLSTGNAVLIEGNNWGDMFWGCIWNNERKLWVGKNHLGVLLMNLREEVKPK